jgi:hypothetical protein
MPETTFLYKSSGIILAFAGYLLFFRYTPQSYWKISQLPRKQMLLFSLIFASFFLAAGGPFFMARLLSPETVILLAVSLSILNVFSTVIILELIRLLIPRGQAWSDRKHIKLLVGLWIIFSAITTVGTFLSTNLVSKQ